MNMTYQSNFFQRFESLYEGESKQPYVRAKKAQIGLANEKVKRLRYDFEKHQTKQTELFNDRQTDLYGKKMFLISGQIRELNSSVDFARNKLAEG